MKQKFSFSQKIFLFCFCCFPMLNIAQRDVYLVIGQSNTAGRGTIEAEDMVTLTGVDLYNGSTWESAVNTAAADGGLNRYSTIQNPAQDQGLNYSYTFGRMLNEITGNQIGLVVNARGGTSIDSWAKGHADDYYGEAITQINAALALGGSTLKGILWHQGESDRNDSSYLTKITTLINDLRTDLGISDLPVIVGELSKQRTDNGTFNTNIKKLSDSGDPAYIANTDYVSSDGLQTTDRTHFNSNAQRVLGYRYAAKVLKLIYGFTYVQNEVVYVTEDAYIRGGTNADTAQEPLEDDILRVKEVASNANNTRRGLLKFDISSLKGANNRTIVDATLMMNADVTSGPIDISFHDIHNNWSESTVTYNSAPTFSTQLTASTTTFNLDSADDDGDSDTTELIHGGADLTEFIKDEYNSGTNTISLGLKSETDGSPQFKPTTKEHTDFALRPYIVVSYLEKPVTLQNVSTKLAKLTFETDPTDTDPAITDISYTTSHTEFVDYSDPSKPEYFTRTTDTLSAVSFNRTNDLGDYFFTAQNIVNNKTSLRRLYLEQIDISGYENLKIRVYLAEMPNTTHGWDNNFEDTESFLDSSTGTTQTGSGQNDYVHFDYDIDNSGTFSPALWVESEADKYDETSNDNQDPRIDTDFDGTGDGTMITDTFVQFEGNISGIGDVLDIEIVFRMNGHQEDIAIDNIEIWGDLINSTCSGTNVTWDGSSWSNGSGPNITTPAVINGAYSTATDGSFSACSLTVNDDLTIGADYYVEVEHDVTVNASAILLIENNGTFIQNNDTASFINNGTSVVRKNTDNLDNWYDYTYWSSPVSGLTIGTSPLADCNRRYWFNASNYLDVLIEDSGNSNTFSPGSDGIDDNGNDWQAAGSSTAMTPGVGFIASHQSTGFVSGTSYAYDFEGTFNNGIITTPVVYDAANTGGHWNLLGNPYPSALDFDAFVTNNPGVIEGVAYLWSHATSPSASTNGNEALNFSQADYIIMNTGSGSVNNSPGTLLEYIPAGQSFFVIGLDNANVTFNNSMRIKNPDSNTQFYKSSNKNDKELSQENKIWINLSSNNGVFNQVLIAYVDGATDDYDGMTYDAPRKLTSGVASLIYTLIESNNNKKYAIQGKHKSSLDENEIIPIGFYTSTDPATEYEFSIDHLQGEFFSNNIVYLRDKLLKKEHNLSISNYSFTSETGEFNNRFELAFKSDLLSLNEIELTNASLKIISLDDKLLNFKLTANKLVINNIAIYDLLGRNLYKFNVKSNSAIYKLDELKNATYLAKVTLSNNTILFKKFIIP